MTVRGSAGTHQRQQIGDLGESGCPRDPREVCRTLRDAFVEAYSTSRTGSCEHFFVFADRRVRIRVAGQLLARRILRPFWHLHVDQPVTERPALTIDVWDEAESKIPARIWQPDLPKEPRIIASPDGRFVEYQRTQTWTCFDRQSQQITCWVADSKQLTLYELGRPFHAPLLLWHRDLGMETAHAGLVCWNGKGVFFAGEGGSGKSTSTLSCLFDGFGYLSDDYVALEAQPHGGYVGHSLYSSTHVKPADLLRFPQLAPLAIQGRLPEEDKSLVLLHDIFPERLERVAPIDALVLPIVTGVAEPRIRPASKGQALLRLAPTSLLMLPHATTEGLDRLADLVESLPCYWLELGEGVAQIAPRIKALLSNGG